MTTLPVFGGPLKQTIIKRARAMTGQADYNYQITPEEYTDDLIALDAIMFELQGEGIDLGYNFPTSNNGSPQDESGIPEAALLAVSARLAQQILTIIGKETPGALAAILSRSMRLLRAQYATIPSSQLTRTTPRGAGNRWRLWRRYYLPREDEDDHYGYPSS